MASEPAIARKTGEGFDQPNADSELPLDVNYQKLTDWLVSRQKLAKDWHKRLQAIQAKAQQEVQSLPAHLLASLPGGSEAPLDYFRAQQIRDRLAQSSDRTLFGGLTGPAAQWDKIVKAYEKQAVYIGEAALTLIQAVDYDVPYLKKQQAKHNQTAADLERKHAEYLRSASTCASNYKRECEKLGVKGVAVREELAALCRELPGLLSGLVAVLRDDERFSTAAQHYAAWTAFAHASSTTASTSTASSTEPLLPVLTEIREGRTAPPPATASSSTAAATQDAGASAGAQPAVSIDLGDLDMLAGGTGGGGTAADTHNNAAAATAGGINWDLDLSVLGGGGGGGESDAAGTAAGGEGPAAVDIQWDIDLGSALNDAAGSSATAADAPVEVNWDIDMSAGDAAGSGAAGGAGAGAINWDIDISDVGAGAGAGAIEIDWGIDTAAAGESVAAAGGAAGASSAGGGVGGEAAMEPSAAAALRLERDADYRARLLDDLQELRAFLVMRKAALASTGQELISQALPATIQEVDGSTIAGMLEAVESALATLTSGRMRQLIMIGSSRRYLDRLVASLQRQAGQEERMRRAAEDAMRRRNEARAALAAAAPKTSELVERCKRIKEAVEGALSGMFGGRRVNVLGDINKVLYAPST